MTPRKPRCFFTAFWAEKDPLLIDLWAHGMGAAAIGHELGVGKEAIWKRARELKLPRRPRSTRMSSRKDAWRYRVCLGGCGREFKSEGSHNRVCDECKSSKRWRAGSTNYSADNSPWEIIDNNSRAGFRHAD